MSRKFIIDVDTGVDDAQALMLALSRPDIDVVAITCVAGNVQLDKVCINTLKVLTICKRLDVSIHATIHLHCTQIVLEYVLVISLKFICNSQREHNVSIFSFYYLSQP